MLQKLDWSSVPDNKEARQAAIRHAEPRNQGAFIF
jgi:hypothetical protein